MRSSFVLVFGLLVAGVAARTVSADTVNFYGDGTTEHFTGTASYDSSAHTLDFSVTNTSSGPSAPTLTAFYFNSAASGITLAPESLGGNVDPFGAYDFGVLGTGIASGQTKAFSFSVSGTVANDSVLNFFTKGGSLAAGEPLVASFDSGVNVGDSIETPLPATASCGLALLGALGIARRSRMRKAKVAK